MREVTIQIPAADAEQNIEIDVKINGRKKAYRYRVEIVAWDQPHPSSEEKVTTLRRIVGEHEKEWSLVTIGVPTDTSIPVMFRKRESPAGASPPVDA